MSLQGLVRRRHKKPGSLELIYTQEDVKRGFEDRPELLTVMGHYRYGFHKFSDRTHHYFTFLRNPIDQLISHYHYTVDHPEKFESLPPDIDNIVDFAKCPYGYNLQTRFVSGIDNLKGQEDEVLAIAHNNLRHNFEMVGLTEEFDLSLLMMGEALDWDILYYDRKNRGKAVAQSQGISEQEREELQKILRYDIQLYQFGKELFEEQKARSPHLVKKLPGFRRRNRLFQRFNPLYTRFKVFLGLAGKY